MMVASSPAAVALLIAWFMTASVSSKLTPIFRAAEAYKGLSADQKMCAVDDTYSAAYKTRCDDKACFCANPQFISDTVDQCLIFYADFLVARPEVYSTENYNSIMMFFGNECGTFQVQTKTVATQSITYTSTLVQTKTQPGGGAATVTGAVNSGSGTSSGTANNQGGTRNTQGEQPQDGGGLSIGAWIGIAASILGGIAALVSIWYKCRRK
ncbi:hypothetical protein N657DRAFT_155160 [Parathielavia appendiculata]|uniref:Extracellular membrane protein CFEM domain-containing protein n=1 Tax=Parathielavia appendiculata TaxID=2587402 RepID=A0AAN6TTJ8_9PEZI|nr:hypothetical protein N657DRAFT_155160 [Parathielavia appendiculata]